MPYSMQTITVNLIVHFVPLIVIWTKGLSSVFKCKRKGAIYLCLLHAFTRLTGGTRHYQISPSFLTEKKLEIVVVQINIKGGKSILCRFIYFVWIRLCSRVLEPLFIYIDTALGRIWFILHESTGFMKYLHRQSIRKVYLHGHSISISFWEDFGL